MQSLLSRTIYQNFFCNSHFKRINGRFFFIFKIIFFWPYFRVHTKRDYDLVLQFSKKLVDQQIRVVRQKLMKNLYYCFRIFFLSSLYELNVTVVIKKLYFDFVLKKKSIIGKILIVHPY